MYVFQINTLMFLPHWKYPMHMDFYSLSISVFWYHMLRTVKCQWTVVHQYTTWTSLPKYILYEKGHLNKTMDGGLDYHRITRIWWGGIWWRMIWWGRIWWGRIIMNILPGSWPQSTTSVILFVIRSR